MPRPSRCCRCAARPLIVWHLETLARAGVREVVINLSWLGEQIRAALGDGGRYGLAHRTTAEEPGARWRPVAASSRPCRCWAPGHSCWSMATCSPISISRRLAARAGCAGAPGAGAESGAPPARRLLRWRRGGSLAEGEPRYTYSGIGVLSPGTVRGLRARPLSAAAAAAACERAGPADGEVHAAAGWNGHAGAAGRNSTRN